jgi:hypothetical protein
VNEHSCDYDMDDESPSEEIAEEEKPLSASDRQIEQMYDKGRFRLQQDSFSK